MVSRAAPGAGLVSTAQGHSSVPQGGAASAQKGAFCYLLHAGVLFSNSHKGSAGPWPCKPG